MLELVKVKKKYEKINENNEKYIRGKRSIMLIRYR